MVLPRPSEIWPLTKQVFFAADRHRLPGSAAEMAFWTLSSLAPIVILMAGALSSIDNVFGSELEADARRQLLRGVEEVFGVGSTVDRAVNDLFNGGSPGALTIGAIVTAYFASRGFTTLVTTLDRVYERKPRTGFWGFIVARVFGVVLGVCTVLVMGITLAAVVAITEVGAGREWLQPVLAISTMLLVWAWYTTLYHWAPRQRTRWAHDLFGAFLATIATGVATVGVGYYATFFPNTNEVLGVLGGLVVLLMWLWIVSLCILLGGQINALLDMNEEHRRAEAAQEIPHIDRGHLESDH